jgi:hypothetical protein
MYRGIRGDYTEEKGDDEIDEEDNEEVPRRLTHPPALTSPHRGEVSSQRRRHRGHSEDRIRGHQAEAAAEAAETNIHSWGRRTESGPSHEIGRGLSADHHQGRHHGAGGGCDICGGELCDCVRFASPHR